MSVESKSAVAIFVKTPPLSPVKTRLAEDIGQDRTLEFYHLALDAVRETVAKIDAHIYWAVGEEEGVNDALWSSFETLWTGEGCLGARQHHIYKTLLEKHGRAVLIGADAPQVSPEYIQGAIEKLEDNDFVIGPAHDGGYVLFGGRKKIEKEIWTRAPWSAANTRVEFEKLLPSKPYYLTTLTDIDEVQDLKAMVCEMPEKPSLSQQKLIDWVNR